MLRRPPRQDHSQNRQDQSSRTSSSQTDPSRLVSFFPVDGLYWESWPAQGQLWVPSERCLQGKT